MKITKAQLKELTDSRSWQRGVDYHQCGNVLSLLEDKDVVVGKVSGTRNYKVKLWVEDGELDGSCDCPMGDAGVFCKHCVAVGLTYLEGGVKSAPQGKSSKQSRTDSEPSITVDDVRKYLSGQETDALVEIIIEQLMEDDHLRRRLMIKAARHQQKGPNIKALRKLITEATNTGGFVDYYSAYDFSRGIQEAVDSIEELLSEGYAKEVIELTEYALGRVEEALGEMDDSDGYMGDILERLQEIHHKACVKAKPDPEALAKRLFEWELTTDWDTFDEAAETYADVLGKKGLAVYRRLAEAEWQKLAPLKPGQMGGYFGQRFRLTSIMESLARVDGNVEALVDIKRKDLSSAYRFLEIALVYKDAGESDKALQWAEKGLQAFPEHTDSRLREFLANEYHRRKRHAEAMQLIWADFMERPGLGNYKLLKKHAERTGEWAKWRQQALEHIRAVISEGKKGPRRMDRYWFDQQDHSTLVEIFIWEKQIEAAWQEAKAGGCSDYLWLELAKLREKEHPADAIDVYQARIDPIVSRTNNRAYIEAMQLIKKIRQLMKNLNKEKEFTEYISSLKVKYKPKRNFIKLLGRLR
ncbi:MAG: SWIM zinc finger domain-containing protein [Sedimentisphaerales bacterium]